MDAATAALAGAVATAMAAGLGALLKAWVDGRRVDEVEGPRAATEAWQAVFASMQEQLNGIWKRVAALEVAVEQRDNAIAERDGVIRRLREYVGVLQALLHRNEIPVPSPTPPEESEAIAPERRSPIATVHLDATPPKEHE